MDDTFQYIRHRLHKAGLADLIFTNKALLEIYKRTNGIPREINRACKIALDYGFSEGVDVIDTSIMKYVFNDIYRFERKKNNV
jgi:type II secretory pathway predicted ATPase ExeA